MTLAEFLKDNPDAQAEIDQKVTAGVESFTVALAEGRQALDSEAYPSVVKGAILDMAMAGNSAGVTAAITVFDQVLEQRKAEEAAQAILNDTPAEVPPEETNGVVASMADADLAAAKLRTQQGA